MRCPVASFFLLLTLPLAIALGQTKSQTDSRTTSQSGTHARRSDSRSKPPNGSTQNSTIRICQGVAIPSGYTIVAYETSSSCPHGAYLLKKDDMQSRFLEAPKGTTAQASNPQTGNAQASPTTTSASTTSRPRRVSDTQVASVAPQLKGVVNTSNSLRPPTLSGLPLGAQPGASPKDGPSTTLDEKKDDEVSEGDVVRIDTNLVTVPVSVLDRDGRFVPDLRRDNFKVLENGVEQRIAYFEPTEKPFTVALLLDTSSSTYFHLSEIKDAAIAFAKQLRPQDRVLVVTFDDQVLLLTEATSDLNVVTQVIDTYANTGQSTRLYDAIDLVINERLNKIQGRKAIVLFTDGVDTSSYGATYLSTLRQAEELDALIYPIQYDTTDYLAASQPSITIVTTRTGNWPFPNRSSSQTIYGPPSITGPGSTMADYKLADRYLHQLADKTGARLYKANDNKQLAEAFSKIAEELRCQYSLGYYPTTAAQSGERRLIKVSVDRPNLAVRAKDSYMQRVSDGSKE